MPRIKYPALLDSRAAFFRSNLLAQVNRIWQELWPCCDCCRTPCSGINGALANFPRAWCYDPQDGDWAGNVFPGGPLGPFPNWTGFATPLTLITGLGDAIWADLGPASEDGYRYNGGAQLFYNFCTGGPALKCCQASDGTTKLVAIDQPCPPNYTPVDLSVCGQTVSPRVPCANNLYPCDSWILRFFDGNQNFSNSYDYINQSQGDLGTFVFWGKNGFPAALPAGVPATVTLTPITSNGNTVDTCKNFWCPGTQVPLRLYATFLNVLLGDGSSTANINGMVIALDYCRKVFPQFAPCFPDFSHGTSGVWFGSSGIPGNDGVIDVVMWFDQNGVANLLLRFWHPQSFSHCIGTSGQGIGQGFVSGNDGIFPQPMQPNSPGACSQFVFTWTYNYPGNGFTWLSSQGAVNVMP